MSLPYLNRLSIVISVYNCDTLVKRCIDSLIKTLGGKLPELIIADNAHSPTTRELLTQYKDFDVQYYPMPKDLGFAGANNIGFSHTTHEFVILVNSDTVFHENPFGILVDFMDTHPNAMVAQGTVALENGIPGEDGKLDTCGAGITTTGRITNPANHKNLDDPAFSFPRKVFYAYGALFFLRREAVSLAGGFLFRPEFYAYYEETDFCHRIWLGGGEVWYVPTPIVGHAHTATFKKQYNFEKLGIFLTSNRRSSFLSCLGTRGLVKIYLLSELVFAIFCIGFLVHGNFSGPKIFVESWLRSIKSLFKTMRLRRTIQRQRKMTDATFITAFCQNTTILDFIKECRGVTT